MRNFFANSVKKNRQVRLVQLLDESHWHELENRFVGAFQTGIAEIWINIILLLLLLTLLYYYFTLFFIKKDYLVLNWCFTSTNILRHLKKKPIEEEEKNEEGQVFKCRVCYQMLTNNTALKRHFEYLHSKVFKCKKEECAFEGSRWKLLLRFWKHHGGQSNSKEWRNTSKMHQQQFACVSVNSHHVNALSVKLQVIFLT